MPQRTSKFPSGQGLVSSFIPSTFHCEELIILSPGFVHTETIELGLSSSLRCCLYAVLLSHNSLVPLSLRALILFLVPGAEPMFIKNCFLWALPVPHPFSRSPHTPNTTVIKCENLKTKAPSLLWATLYCVQMSEDVKGKKNGNSQIKCNTLGGRLCLGQWKAVGPSGFNLRDRVLYCGQKPFLFNRTVFF